MLFDRKCKITYIAHGATIYSEEGRFCDGESFPPLSENGVEEINRICDFLKSRRIKNDKIISSAGTRTIQSAKIISKIYKQNFEIIPILTPKKCGSFNGMTFEQIEDKYPDEFKKLIDEPNLTIPEDAESVSDFVSRISDAIDKIVDENIGSRIIVVTYPEIIRVAIAKALCIPDSAIKNIYIKTGSATQISYFDSFESLMYCGYKPV